MKSRTLLLLLPLLGLALLLLSREPEESDSANPDKGSSSGQTGSSYPGPTKLRERPPKSSRGQRTKLHTTPSGLQYEMLVEGTGDIPKPDSTVTVHYEGRLPDGTVFDSSRDRGPLSFELSMVIAGWQEGLQLMRTGGKYRFIIPPELAYGKNGAGSQIPADSTLIFEVELVSFKAKQPATAVIKDGRVEMPVFSTRRVEAVPFETEPPEVTPSEDLPACP